MTRSSGSGMRDLPCAGDGKFRPGFYRPGFSRPRSSRPGFQHQLLHAFTTGQEERNKPESSAAKALLLTSSGAREQESKSSIAYIFRSQSTRAQECKSKSKRENGETLSLFKENYSPPRTYYSLIGCSPSAELSSRGRQSTWGGELPLAHAQIICLPLRTQDVSAILQQRM